MFGPISLLKRDPPTQVFFCGHCEIFKNHFFYRTFLAAASVSFIPISNDFLRQLLSRNNANPPTPTKKAFREGIYPLCIYFVDLFI